MAQSVRCFAGPAKLDEKFHELSSRKCRSLPHQMRTLDRYIFREVAVTCIAVTLVLLVILLSNQLARVLSQAAANDFPREVVFTLIGLTSAGYLTVVVPDRLLPGDHARARAPVSRERDGGDPVVRRRAGGPVPADRRARPGRSWRCWSGCRSGRSRAPPRARSRSASRRCAMRSSARSSRAGSAPSAAATSCSTPSASTTTASCTTSTSSSIAPRSRATKARWRSGSRPAPSSAAPGRPSRPSSSTTAAATKACREAASSASSSSPRAASRSGSAS